MSELSDVSKKLKLQKILQGEPTLHYITVINLDSINIVLSTFEID